MRISCRSAARGSLFFVVTALIALVWALVGPGRNLEYEYTLLVSYSLLLALPLCALAPQPAHGRLGPVSLVSLSLLLLALPPAIIYASGHCLCNQREFWWWWAAQVLPAFFWATALYACLRQQRDKGQSWPKLFGLTLLAVLLVLIHVTCVMWFFPQKRLVHPIAGFLHGPIYDTWIPIDRGIVYARAGHLALAFAFFALVWVKAKRWRYALVSISAGLAMAGAWLAASYPSLGSGKDALTRLLERRLEGRGFTLHYHSDEAEEAEVPPAIARLFHDAQFHHDELSALFGEAAAPQVDIYVYPDANRKKLWFGGGATDVTDVYTPSVHITFGWPHPTLRHELVHALASRQAYHGLGFHPNMAFTEGLAVALAPEEDELSLDEGAAALLRSGKMGDVTRLFSPLFWQEAGARAYTVAGSFINFVRQRYGFAAVTQLYAGAAWEEVFHKEQKQVLEEWQAAVLASSPDDTHTMTAEALYRYPGVWRDLCPHSKATLMRAPSADPWLRPLRWPAGWDKDKDYQSWRLALNPQDNNLVISQFLRRARHTLKNQPTQLADVYTGLSAYSHWPPQTLEDVELKLLASDTAAVEGALADARAHARAIVEVARDKNVGEDLFRQAFARQRLYEEMSWEAAHAWHLFLAGIGPLPSDTPTWLTRYLRFRNFPQTMTLQGASSLAALLNDDIPTSIPASFRLAWFKAIASQAMEEDAYDLAAKAYERAAAVAPRGSRAIFAEHTRRALFYALGHSLPPNFPAE